VELRQLRAFLVDDHPLAGRSSVCVEDLADYDVAARTPAEVVAVVRRAA
jgi:hypothetical protein